MKNYNTTREKLKYALQLNRTLAFVWRASPAAAVLSGILVFIQGLFPLAVLYLIKLIVDEADKAISSPGTGNVAWILTLVAIAAGISLLRTVCQHAADLANETLSMKVSDHIYDRLHRKSLDLDLEFYENPEYFDTLHRAQMEGPHRPAKIVNSLVNIGRDAVSLTAVGGLLLYFHWAVPLILLAAVIPGVLVKVKFSKEMYKWQIDRTGTQREASYLNWLITGYIHAKELRLFDLGEFFSRRFSGLRTLIRDESLQISKRKCIAGILAQLVSVAAMFGTLGFVVFRAVLGMITIGDLVMYYQAIQRGLGFFQNLLNGVSGLYEDNLFISYFYEFMDVEEKIKDPPAPARMPARIKSGFSVENVDFTYPLAGRKTLENINFTIEPGEIIALVGENGAGKSTLAKLLCRLYDPQAGSIAIDGTDIRNFRLNDLRKKIGVMFQDYARYHFTARKNIWLGNIEVDADSEKIRDSARKADAHEFIEKLPEGYDTTLGKMFENGMELSVGQWQKIALARAFMRDSELVILDEPASSMDADSEYEVFKNFRKLLSGRSAVLVSHRFSTVKMADKVIVLENGRICEQGSHRRLLEKNGAYARWFEKQSMVAGGKAIFPL
ncbi:MAG: ABC transporter ATP-binding protein/permease [Desulfobacteraceae bacterium]|nr:ABC transporter ATP-binding protein/permease [Desulfobacteraceae bacterium]